MTNAQAAEVCGQIENYLNGPHGRGFDIGNPQHFEEVVECVRPSVAPVDEDDLRVVVAMCLLGPGSASGTGRSVRWYGAFSPPPETMRAALLTTVRSSGLPQHEQVERVMEFAIAYGGGKGRHVHVGVETWDTRWQGTIRALARMMIGAVRDANDWLREHVINFPARNDNDYWSDASRLAHHLTHPEHLYHLGPGQTMVVTCTIDDTRLEVPEQDDERLVPPGAKAVWSVMGGSAALQAYGSGRGIAHRSFSQHALIVPQGAKVIIAADDDEARINVTIGGSVTRWRLPMGETTQMTTRQGVDLAIWACTCGTTRCQERHHLEAWDPTQVSLQAFVASAVKGPQRYIEAGSFVQGMYFALLTEEDL